MLIQVINLIALFFPLVLFPLLLGSVLIKDRIDVPYRWYFGFLLISLVLIISHALNIPPTVYITLITITILGLTFWQRDALIRKLRRNRIDFTSLNTWVLILIPLFFVIVGWVEIKAHPVTGGDTYSIWLNKAKSIFAGMPYQTFAIVQYPNLGPAFWAFAMRFTGGYEPIYGLYLGPVAYCFWVLAHLGLFKQKNSWIALIILFSIAVLFYDDSVYNGYQDKLLMMGAGISVLTYTQFFRESADSEARYLLGSTPNLFWLGAFFAGMLSLIKTEGTVMGLIIVLGSFLFVVCTQPKQIRYFLKTNYPAILIFGLLIAIWPLIMFTNHIDLSNIQGDNLSLQSVFDVFKNFDRLSLIWPRYLEYFQTSSLMLTLSIFLTLLAVWKDPHIRMILIYIWFIWFAHSAFIAVAFLSTRAPLVWHLNTAFSRLSSQHDFIYPLVIALTIGCLLKNPSPSHVTTLNLQSD